MFDDTKLKEPSFIFEIENPPRLTLIDGRNHIYFNSKFTSDNRTRTYIFQMLIQAQKFLPSGYYFILYEGIRSLSDQIKLWNEIIKQKKNEFPDLDINSEEFLSICNEFVANPYRQGSGHQSGGSIDVSLVNENGIEYDMGGAVRGFNCHPSMEDLNISAEAMKNRKILKTALESVGFINYPPEWWHYSFGDRLWARLTQSPIAFFDKIK